MKNTWTKNKKRQHKRWIADFMRTSPYKRLCKQIGQPGILHELKTHGFASQPHDWFAFFQIRFLLLLLSPYLLVLMATWHSS